MVAFIRIIVPGIRFFPALRVMRYRICCPLPVIRIEACVVYGARPAIGTRPRADMCTMHCASKYGRCVTR